MKPIALIKGGAQPRMMAEEGLEHFHDAEFEEETALDLSEIRAGVEAQLVVNPGACSGRQHRSRAVVQAGPFPPRRRSADEGLRRRQLRSLRKLHPGAQRDMHEMQYLRRDQRLFVNGAN